MVKPDLACSIEGVGPDGKPIADGGSVTYGPGDGDVRISFVITNPSSVRSGQFWLRPCVRVNGQKVYDPTVEMINLDPGESWSHEFDRPFGGTTEEWQASILVDINDFVDESDERNNHGYLSFTAQSSRG